MKTYTKKTYAYKNGRQIVFHGHIKPETAKKRNFDSVTLSIIDFSGKGRGENRRFLPPFDNLRGFN